MIGFSSSFLPFTSKPPGYAALTPISSCRPRHFASSIISSHPHQGLLTMSSKTHAPSWGKNYSMCPTTFFSYSSISVLPFFAINFPSTRSSPSSAHKPRIINYSFHVYLLKRAINSIKAEIKLSCSRL